MSVLADYFSHAYVINLPERTDRRRDVEKELSRVGMRLAPGHLELFPAIRPSELAGFTSIGAHGCFMSHLGVLRKALAQGAKRVLIMEDDVAISSRLLLAERSLVDYLSKHDWGIAYFGHFANDLPLPATDQAMVRADASTLCAHFYAISGAVLPALVDDLEKILTRPAGHPDGGPMHYDGALATFRGRNPGITHFATPSLAWQRNSRSDISALRWFDRVPMARTAVAEARRLVHRWRRWLRPAGP
jgi:glycosyl transferase, family 25